MHASRHERPNASRIWAFESGRDSCVPSDGLNATAKPTSLLIVCPGPFGVFPVDDMARDVCVFHWQRPSAHPLTKQRFHCQISHLCCIVVTVLGNVVPSILVRNPLLKVTIIVVGLRNRITEKCFGTDARGLSILAIIFIEKPQTLYHVRVVGLHVH